MINKDIKVFACGPGGECGVGYAFDQHHTIIMINKNGEEIINQIYNEAGNHLLNIKSREDINAKA
jgi:hypothetical protein